MPGWLASSVTAFQQAVLSDINTQGLSRNEAIDRTRDRRQRNPYTYLKPEQASSFEGGYRGSLLHGRLQLNLDGYFNGFRNFIAQVNMNVPQTTNPDSVAAMLNDRSRQSLYRMYTNSRSRVFNYGGSAGVAMRLPKGFTASGNLSLAQLKRRGVQDGLEDGFNTPEWILNLMLGKQDLVPRLDAGINWHWQSGYYWQSFLVNGPVPAYSTFDAQISYRVPSAKLRFKAGASNLLNRRYVSSLGGPSIGDCLISLWFMGCDERDRAAWIRQLRQEEHLFKRRRDRDN